MADWDSAFKSMNLFDTHICSTSYCFISAAALGQNGRVLYARVWRKKVHWKKAEGYGDTYKLVPYFLSLFSPEWF